MSSYGKPYANNRKLGMQSWRKTLLKPTDTVTSVIQCLERAGMQIALVVDEQGKLLGTITDGDIRRALVRPLGMNALAGDIMFAKPVTASAGDSRETILGEMKNAQVLQVPILDAGGCVVGLETLQHLLTDEKIDTPVCLMAGGFGMRLLPLTNRTPKPLLKVGSKPILETVLTQFIKAGFHNFYISIHYKGDMVQRHFGDGKKWGVNIHYLHEQKPLGTAGGLGLLPKSLPDSKIIVMNGDLITNLDLNHVLQFHSEEGGVATLCVREYDFQVPYGVVKVKENRAQGIQEKPIHSFFVSAGIYVLSSALVKNIEKNCYLDMPKFLEQQIVSGERVSVFPVHEYWIDIGCAEEYERAKKDIAGLGQ
jgi:dTDP-glucose pyrophosphorylase/CBS domain-containing protein